MRQNASPTPPRVGGNPAPRTTGAFAPVLAVSNGADGCRRLAAVLGSLGVDFRCTEQLAPDDLAFALRKSAVVLVVGAPDPVAAVAELLSVGLDCRLMVLAEGLPERVKRDLTRMGVASICPLTVSDARIKSELTTLTLLRRVSTPTGLVLDPLLHTVRSGQAVARLSPHEFALLQFLVDRARHAVGAQTLRLVAWGAELPNKSAEQILTVSVCRLRRKLEPLGAAFRLRTVRNVGYILTDELSGDFDATPPRGVNKAG